MFKDRLVENKSFTCTEVYVANCLQDHIPTKVDGRVTGEVQHSKLFYSVMLVNVKGKSRGRKNCIKYIKPWLQN